MDLLAWVWPVPVLVLAIWLILRVRRDVQGRSRWLLYPVVGVLALLAVGGAVETVIEATDGGRPPPAASWSTSAGTSCSSRAAARGARPSSSRAASARVRTTSRASPRRSHRRPACAPTTGPAAAAASPRPVPRTARRSPATSMRSSRRRATTAPTSSPATPRAGSYVRFFAAAYPDEVAGVVLLDAQSPHATPAQSGGQSSAGPDQHARGVVAGPRPRRRRPTRVFGRVERPAAGGRGPPTRRRGHPAGASSFGDEFARLDGILDAAGALPNLGDRPLVVVTAMAEASTAGWTSRTAWPPLSTNVSHRVFQDLTHDGLIESLTRRHGGERRHSRRRRIHPIRDESRRINRGRTLGALLASGTKSLSRSSLASGPSTPSE